MIALSVDQQNALLLPSIMRRFFVWVEGRDPDYGTPEPVGFWDDVGNVSVLSRTYYGSGSLISIASLSAKGDLTIPGLQITFSGLDLNTIALVRGEAISQAAVEVHLGIFNTTNHAIIGVPILIFTGFLDDCDISTPEAGGTSTITFTCESTSRALTIKRTATRSASSLFERNEVDKFYNFTPAQRTKPVYFGKAAPIAAVTLRGGPSQALRP